VAHLTALVEELTAQRAEERIGETIQVLVENLEDGPDSIEGRAAFQGPEVDGTTTLLGAPSDTKVGDLLTAEVTGTEGVDLVATVTGASR
jgi:ribosomal protein S12 methylthiotransferase